MSSCRLILSSVLAILSAVPAAAQQHPSSTFYHCQNETTLEIDSGPADGLTVRYGPSALSLHRVPSADGLRFTDGRIVWWSKGRTGTFFPDAQSRGISCQQGPATQLGAAVILSTDDQVPTAPVSLSLGDDVTFQLPVQAGTGYRYVLRGATNPSVLQALENSVVPPQQIGGRSRVLFGFTAAHIGSTALQFDLISPGRETTETLVYFIQVK